MKVKTDLAAAQAQVEMMKEQATQNEEDKSTLETRMEQFEEQLVRSRASEEHLKSEVAEYMKATEMLNKKLEEAEATRKSNEVCHSSLSYQCELCK